MEHFLIVICLLTALFSVGICLELIRFGVPGIPKIKPRMRVVPEDEKRRRLGSAFGEGSRSSFSGSSLFSNGGINQDFTNTLDTHEREGLTELENYGRELFDLEAIFNNSLAEDLQFFIQEYSDMDKRVFTKFLESPETVTATDLRRLPLHVMASVNEAALQEKASRLPNDTKKMICKRLQMAKADLKDTRRIVKQIPCASILAGDQVRPSQALAKALAANEMEAEDLQDWDMAKWERAFTEGWASGLTERVMEDCPPEVLQRMTDRVGSLMENMNPKLKRRLKEKVKNSLGGLSTLNSTMLGKMKDMVAGMSFKELRKLNPSAVRESMASLKQEVSKMTRLQRMQLKRSVKTGTSPDSMSGDDVVNAAAFIGKDRSVVRRLDRAALLRNLTELGQQKLDRKSSRLFAKKIREDAEYDEATDYDTEKFLKMGKVAAGFSPRFLKKMTNVNFSSVLEDGSLKDVDFSKSSARSLIKRIKSDSGSIAGRFDRRQIEKLGKAIVGLRVTDIEEMDSEDLAEALTNMTDTLNEVAEEMDSGATSKMVAKVLGASGNLGERLEKMGKLQKKIPVKRLKNIPDSEFGDMTGQTERNFECNSNTCPELYKRVVNSIGRPGLRNPNFTLTTFMNLKDVMCGMPLSDMKEMPATTVLEDVAGFLLKRKCLSDKQERVLAEKLKYRLGFFGTQVRELTSEDAKNFGGMLKHFTVEELSSFGQLSCSDIVLELGGQDLSNVKKGHLKQLALYALECINKTAGSLTADDVMVVGDLVCGLPFSRIADIGSDAMEDAVYTVQSRCEQLDADEKREWGIRAMERLNISTSAMQNVEGITLIQMGTLITEIGKENFCSIASDILESVAPDLVDQFDELAKRLKARDRKGFGGDVSSTDRAVENSKRTDVYTCLLEAVSSTSSSRKRRQTAALTCADMQLLGSGITAMTTTQIEAVADEEMLDCVQTLGSYSTWTSQQITSLINVVKKAGVLGPTSGWTAENVYDVGIIAQGLTTAEISSLPALSSDSMASLGKHSGWSETQLSSGFERWLTLNHAGDASTLTSSDLASLGHFACGASTTHIDSISSTAYGDAAQYIGSLTSCNTYLSAWASLAKNAFGAVSTWDTSVITTVGNVIGGLSPSDVSGLSLTQVAAIQPTSIAAIPPETFQSFTSEQLAGYSVAQAQSVTQAQLDELSADQVAALGSSSDSTSQDSESLSSTSAATDSTTNPSQDGAQKSESGDAQHLHTSTTVLFTAALVSSILKQMLL